MKTQILAMLLLTMLGFSGGLLAIEPTTTIQDPSVYRHVVLFKFKEEATEEQIDQIVKQFRELPKQIKTVIDFEYGMNISPEKLDQGLTHCFLVTFKDKAGLEAYLPHEAHQKFVAQLKPILAEVLVVDYWSKQ